MLVYKSLSNTNAGGAHSQHSQQVHIGCYATKLLYSGSDLGGGRRGCAPLPEMTYSFLIQLVFCEKKGGLLVLVTRFLSGAPPPKKNPGSALYVIVILVL